MTSLVGLLLAAAIDGGAAQRHAAALASLGPHPWGSPRNEAAAQYVAAQLRAAGLADVELQRFERHGLAGTNVVGTLRAGGEEFLLVGAHHDSAPGAPGAYDDGGGVGVLIELARVLAAEPHRARTVVFASFDGEEAEVLGKGQTAGSRAWFERLGARSDALVAALAIEMSGWRRGTPLVHPIAYADPRRKPRGNVIAPGWLVAAALAGSRDAGVPFRVGDPYLSWLYQPAVRTFRVRLYGDDLSVLQGRRPALMASDSSFSSFNPAYHTESDTADRVDPASLERMGRAALGTLRALEHAPRTALDLDRHWFAAFGYVLDWRLLLGLGVSSLVPVLVSGVRAGGAFLAVRALQAVLFAVLLWREPVPALWALLPANLLSPVRGRWHARLASLAPAFALLVFGAAAWWRGAVNGVWLAPWEIAAYGLTLALAQFGAPPSRGRAGRQAKGRGRKNPGLPKRRRG